MNFLQCSWILALSYLTLLVALGLLWRRAYVTARLMLLAVIVALTLVAYRSHLRYERYGTCEVRLPSVSLDSDGIRLDLSDLAPGVRLYPSPRRMR